MSRSTWSAYMKPTGLRRPNPLTPQRFRPRGLSRDLHAYYNMRAREDSHEAGASQPSDRPFLSASQSHVGFGTPYDNEYEPLFVLMGTGPDKEPETPGFSGDARRSPWRRVRARFVWGPLVWCTFSSRLISPAEWSERSWDAKPSKRLPDSDPARAVANPAVRAAEAIEVRRPRRRARGRALRDGPERRRAGSDPQEAAPWSPTRVSQAPGRTGTRGATRARTSSQIFVFTPGATFSVTAIAYGTRSSSEPASARHVTGSSS